MFPRGALNLYSREKKTHFAQPRQLKCLRGPLLGEIRKRMSNSPGNLFGKPPEEFASLPFPLLTYFLYYPPNHLGQRNQFLYSSFPRASLGDFPRLSLTPFAK